MKIALLATMTAIGLGLVACGSSDKPSSSTPPTGGGSPPANSGPATDFVASVQALVGAQPPFGTTPADTSALTTNLALGSAGTFSSTSFGSGDALPAGTNQASVACTQAGKTSCDPTTSADLNSTLN